jgi:hypothetical protein
MANSEPLSLAEQQRLDAELRRIDAKTAKLNAEKAEIDKRINETWWSGRYLIQAVIAGITIAGLLVAWIKVQLEPMLTAKQEKASIEIEIGKKLNELESVRNQISQEQLRRDLAELKEKNRDLLTQQSLLQKSAESRLQIIRQKGIESAAIQKELDDLQTQIRELRDAKAQTEQRLQNLGAVWPFQQPTTVDELLRRREIKAAQEALSRLGFYYGSADGLAGLATRSAIRKFQALKGLPETGDLDQKTKSALEITGWDPRG